MPRRRPPRVLAAASAVLLAGVVGLWVRSYWREDYVMRRHAVEQQWLNRTQWEVASAGGRVTFLYDRYREEKREPAPRWLRFLTGEPERLGWYWQTYRPEDGRVENRSELSWKFATSRTNLGFARYCYGTRRHCLDVSYWFLAIVVAVPLLRRLIPRRGPPPGHCRTCGYDLTANASGRCPECGAEVPAAAAERHA
jgi:hypothetical protein